MATWSVTISGETADGQPPVAPSVKPLIRSILQGPGTVTVATSTVDDGAGPVTEDLLATIDVGDF